MNKIIIFLILISSTNVFSEEYNCFFNKWFDSVIDAPVFSKFQRNSDNFLGDDGNEYSIMFEDKKTLTLINSKNRFAINTIILNKETKKITKSLTEDDRVVVIKGYCN